MNGIMLHKTGIISTEGETVKMVYHEGDDMLDIFFGENEPSTGIEITDHILLRINRETGRAVSLSIRHFSILTERTEYGPRSYPLDNLNQLPEELREKVIHAATSFPVNQFLKISHFQASPTNHIPLTYIEPYRFASAG